MVFLPTAKWTEYAAEIFRTSEGRQATRGGLVQMCTPSPHAAVGCPNVLSLHSRKTQPQRTATAAEFRAARQAVLFTSDVSARGVDYPDVTLVVQASDV